MKVVYIHHCGVFGGSSRSIMELILSFPYAQVKPFIISQKGSAAEMFTVKGIDVDAVAGIPVFDHTRMGYYRGLRWFILIREFLYTLSFLYTLIRNKRHIKDADVVHINDYHLLLPVILIKKLFKKPIVLHSRCIQQSKYGKIRQLIFKHVADNFADKVIAIDQNVYDSMPSKKNVEIIHNGFIVQNTANDNSMPYGWPVKENGYINIGFVGNMIEYKGILEFVQSVKICNDAGIKANFIIIGPNKSLHGGLKGFLVDTLGLSKNINIVIEEFIKKEKLTNIYRVDFQKDLAKIYNNLDVLCFPSYLEGAGRPVFEAAFFKVPSIVAITNPQDDTIIHRKTGMCIEPRNTIALADAIIELASNDKLRKDMGEEAYKLACKNFDIELNAIKVLKIYNEILDKNKSNFVS